MNRAVLIGLILIALIVAGLGYYWYSSGKTGPNNATASRKVLVYAYEDSITGIDPSIEFDTGLVVLGLVYEPLIYYNPLQDKFIPALATSWEANENHTVWTFHLRRDAKFHDGTPVTSQAVKFSIMRALEYYEKTGEGPGYIWEDLVRIETPDNYTVKFIMDKPMRVDFLVSASYGSYIYSPRVLEESGVKSPFDEELLKWFNQGHEDGSGPYMIESYNPESMVKLVKFRDWWGWKIYDINKAPDVLIIKIVTDEVSQENGLLAGQIDIATTVPLQDISKLLKQGFSVLNTTTYHNYVLMFNTRRYPTNITEFRLAVAHAIPWDRVYREALLGYGRIDNSLIPYGFPGHLDNYTYTYNLTLAREYLEKAGLLGKDLRVEIMYEGTYSQESLFAQILKGSLAQLGITVELKPASWDQMAETGPTVWDNPDQAPHMIINDWWPTLPSPYDFLYSLLHSDSKEWNWAGYNNTLFNNLIDKAWDLEGSNYEEAMKLYVKAQNIVYEEAPAIGLWDEIKPYVYNPRHVAISGEAFNPLYMYVLFIGHLEVKG